MTDVDFIANVAKALGHPARVRIVRLLAGECECRGQEVFAELDLAQSTVSEHLRILREAGIVDSHPVGVEMVYCLDRGVVRRFVTDIEASGAADPDSPVCS